MSADKFRNIRTLNRDEVRRILFGNDHYGLYPTKTWFASLKKRPPLPIDKWLATTKLRSASELAALNILCPRFWARIHIGLAMDATADALLLKTGSHRPNGRVYSLSALGKLLSARAKEMSALARHLRALAAKPELFYIAPRVHRHLAAHSPSDVSAAERALKNAMALLRSAEIALDDLAARAKQESRRLRPLGAQGDVWKIVFVISLGFFFRVVTGRNPSHSSKRFGSLIRESYKSLGGDPAEKWERAIRTACKHVKNRSASDRWDRYEKSIVRTGVA